MKKIKAILLSAMVALGLAACNEKEDEAKEPEQCQHIDENKDHVCDKCDEPMGEHKDDNHDGKCDYCEQNIPAVLSIEIEGAEETLVVGRTLSLTANVSAVGGASAGVTWSVDDETKASVSSSGVVTAKAEGSVTVTATSKADSTKSTSVTISIIATATDWSNAAKQLMSEQLHGVVIPFLGPTWSDPILDEDGVSSESETGDLDDLMSLLQGAGFSVSKVNFTIVQGVTAPGLSISKEQYGLFFNISYFLPAISWLLPG